MKNKFLVLFVIFMSSLSAQNIIKGQILDNNKTPIEGANVYWQNTSVSTITDKNGNFEIEKTAKTNKLIISYVGFKTLEIEITTQEFISGILLNNQTLKEVVVEKIKKSTEYSKSKATNIQTLGQKELLKAACCNLSESFSTNPTIDVNFTDGVTGNKQIKMLGLTSPYIVFTEENIPVLRGFEQNFGLNFVPGTWIESIQITKGAGSVINGYESISGQINYEILKPISDIPFFLNLYGSTDNRFEINLHQNQKFSDKLSSSIFIHGNARPMKMDKNTDGFLDNPMGKQINLANKWQYQNHETGIISFLTLKYVTDNKQGGQTSFNHEKDKGTNNAWGSEIDTEKIQISSKIGYSFKDMPYQSIGFQNAYNYQKQDSYFGLNHYNNSQKSLYSNLIFNSIISNTKNKFAVGLNFIVDNLKQHLKVNFTDDKYFNNQSTGAFFEYTYDNIDNFSLIAGVRVDSHNRLGNFITPRLHVRYNPWNDAVLRVSTGRGKRWANYISENQHLLNSSRNFIIEQHINNTEIAWNYGFNFIQNLKIGTKNIEFIVDYYVTKFDKQVVIDLENSRNVNLYNLKGKSFATSFQIECSVEFNRHTSLRTAYKYYDVQTNFKDGLLLKTFTPKTRIFSNFSYESHIKNNGKQWKFDSTYNWTGKQRLPNTANNPLYYQLNSYAESFGTINAQITRSFSKNLEIYIGAENLTNYTQKNAIIAASEPFSDYFDSSMIYAPIFGKMFYTGLRFKIR